MDPKRQFSHFKLLTATDQFFQRIAATDPDCSPLTARLVFSWLAHRSRLGLGASARDISLHTGLHPTTVAVTLDSLAGLIERQANNWIALEPPPGMFFEITPTKPVHWSDHCAYLMLFLPEKGAKVCYSEVTRRFGLNHSLIWSFLFRQAKDGVVRRFTVAGAAALFCLDPKTVKAVLDDLLWLRMIDRVDLGRSSEITLLPLTEANSALFRPKPESDGTRVEPTEKKPCPAAAPYKYRGDLWDACRRFCEGLMSQKKAEAAIRKAQQLGDTPDDFESLFRRAKERHDNNILSGKVAKGNFGRYLHACFDRRLMKLAEQKKVVERLQQLETYYTSPEYLQKSSDEQKAADADPSHPLFTPSQDAVLDRVQFDPNPLKNIRAWDRFSTALSKNIAELVRDKHLTTQQEIDLKGTIRDNILKHALSALNSYYQQPVLASSENFLSQINNAIPKVAPGIPLLQPVVPAVNNALSHN